MASEDVHIDRIDAAGAEWSSAVRTYIRGWGRPSADGAISDDEQRAADAERRARATYEQAKDDYRLHLRGLPHDD